MLCYGYANFFYVLVTLINMVLQNTLVGNEYMNIYGVIAMFRTE